MPMALTSPPLRAGGLVALLDASQTPRSDLTTRRSGHQCIDAVSACTKRHYEEHAAHHREVSEERRSVSACGRRITYGPIVMENQCKGKRVKEKGESYPTGIKPGYQHQAAAQFEGYGTPNQNI